MARKDWHYVPIPMEMSDAVDFILKTEGKKYGYLDKNAFVRSLVADFIARYEEKKNIVIARKAVKNVDGNDVPQPDDRIPLMAMI